MAWQKARTLVIAVHRYSQAHWCAALGDVLSQLRRAALSTDLNIVEGHALGAGRKCRNHFRIALASAAETAAALELLRELTTSDARQLDDLVALANETRYLTFRLWQRSRG